MGNFTPLSLGKLNSMGSWCTELSDYMGGWGRRKLNSMGGWVKKKVPSSPPRCFFSGIALTRFNSCLNLFIVDPYYLFQKPDTNVQHGKAGL